MIHHQFILFSHSYFINIQYSVMNIPSQKVSTLVKKFQKNPHSPVPILKKITKQKSTPYFTRMGFLRSGEVREESPHLFQTMQDSSLARACLFNVNLQDLVHSN